MNTPTEPTGKPFAIDRSFDRQEALRQEASQPDGGGLKYGLLFILVVLGLVGCVALFLYSWLA